MYEAALTIDNSHSEHIEVSMPSYISQVVEDMNTTSTIIKIFMIHTLDWVLSVLLVGIAASIITSFVSISLVVIG